MADGGITIKVEGMEQAKKLLDDLKDKLPREVDIIIEDAGESIFANSQREVPVDTGTLQRSGSHSHQFMKSEVGYNTDYAVMVHDGTSKMRPRPYLRGPAEKEIPRLIKKLEEAGK